MSGNAAFEETQMLHRLIVPTPEEIAATIEARPSIIAKHEPGENRAHTWRSLFHETCFKPLANRSRYERAYRRSPLRLSFLITVTGYAGASTEWRGDKKRDEAAEEQRMPTDEDGITCVIRNNAGVNRVPFTPWILLHRMAHAMQMRGADYGQYERRMFTIMAELLDATYGDTFGDEFAGKSGLETKSAPHNVLQFFMTTRAARRLVLSNELDVFAELFAQYMFSGRVKLRQPRELPQRHALCWGWMADSPAKPVDIQPYETRLNDLFGDLLTDLRGKRLAF
jgi:hypothetical protein